MILEIDVKQATDRDFIEALHFCAKHDPKLIVGHCQLAKDIAEELEIPYSENVDLSTHTYRKKEKI